jgi:hypothetical protein
MTDIAQLKRKITALEWLKKAIQYQPIGPRPDRRKVERRSKVHSPRVEVDARKHIRRIDDLVSTIEGAAA